MSHPPLAQFKNRATAHWRGLGRREQNLVLLAAAIVGLALLWWVLLAPALQSLRSAPARHAQADAQLAQMREWQAEAEQLRAQAQPLIGDAKALLQSSLSTELGTSAQLNWLGDRAQITLKSTPAPALSRWLAQVRSNTHALPAEMKLQRSPGEDQTLHWNGTLMLDLPAAKS
ncbi:type II secretion system protein GspM [Comamonas composti]|uniref:type II secretion system protein GspM n=1 Tax=Comamonas composti TaxID=408558 RepID=UPI0004129D31|nr:type II secretion system protein GspM [Comamonas composti]